MSKCAFSVWNVNFFIKTLMCLSHSKNIFTCFQGNIMWKSLWKLSYSTIVCVVWRPGSHFTGFFNKIDFFVKPIQKHITMNWIFLIHANLFPKIVSHFIGGPNSFIFPDKQEEWRTDPKYHEICSNCIQKYSLAQKNTKFFLFF